MNEKLQAMLDELLLFMRVELVGDDDLTAIYDDDSLEVYRPLPPVLDDFDQALADAEAQVALFSGETCRNCGYNHETCTCIGGFIDEYEVNENGWKN